MLSALDGAVEATSKGRFSECGIDDVAAAVSFLLLAARGASHHRLEETHIVSNKTKKKLRSGGLFGLQLGKWR